MLVICHMHTGAFPTRIIPKPIPTAAIPVSGQLESSGEVEDDSEQYITMSPGQGNITSDDSDSDTEGQYVPMNPLSIER